MATPLSWDNLWSIFGTMPDDRKKIWMVELIPHLKELAEMPSFRKEVFENAPAEVQQYFGYKSNSSQAQGKPKSVPDLLRARGYNDEQARQMLALLK